MHHHGETMPKKNNVLEAYLYCDRCDADTPHEVIYKNNQVSQITCKKCGLTFAMNQSYINRHFKEEFIARVLTKPARMTREMQRDLDGFLKSLPYRVITKPYRLYREIEEHKDEK